MKKKTPKLPKPKKRIGRPKKKITKPKTKMVVINQDNYSHSEPDILESVNQRVFQKNITDYKPVAVPGQAMDESYAMDFSIKNQFLLETSQLPNGVLNWYASQSFIGFQMCSLLSQNWLIYKCCDQPAKDAVRKGFEITVNDGTKIDTKVLDKIREFDKKYLLNKNMIELIRMGRIFGVRIVMFKVESNDPQYYEKPFNPDGIMPGSYKGMSQIDPYWIMPQLDMIASSDPAAINFYEPTWWQINGMRIHRSHLIIMRQSELPDILKPTYLFGGISICQQIYARIYASERTADEAPLLALAKRLNILKTNTNIATAKPQKTLQRLQEAARMRDNWGIWMIDKDLEEAQQFDTSLTDLDAIIMTQYQIVAAIAGVPITKLLGTVPKGFNATGEYDEASYHEMLESYQTSDLNALIERHHLLVMRSDIAPMFNIAPFETSVKWLPLDSMTAKEKAEVEEIKSRTGLNYIQGGVINGQDERKRIVNDIDSGYNGLTEEIELPEIEEPEIPEDDSSAPTEA